MFEFEVGASMDTEHMNLNLFGISVNAVNVGLWCRDIAWERLISCESYSGTRPCVRWRHMEFSGCVLSSMLTGLFGKLTLANHSACSFLLIWLLLDLNLFRCCFYSSSHFVSGFCCHYYYFLDVLYFFIYVYGVGYVYMSAGAVRSQKRIRSPGAGVAGGCEVTDKRVLSPAPNCISFISTHNYSLFSSSHIF